MFIKEALATQKRPLVAVALAVASCGLHNTGEADADTGGAVQNITEMAIEDLDQTVKIPIDVRVEYGPSPWRNDSWLSVTIAGTRQGEGLVGVDAKCDGSEDVVSRVDGRLSMTELSSYPVSNVAEWSTGLVRDINVLYSGYCEDLYFDRSEAAEVSHFVLLASGLYEDR